MKLEFDGLTMSIGAEPVIKNLCFSAEMKTLAVIGPSGGGKSTLLRLVGGLLQPTSGEIRLNGIPIPKTVSGLLEYRRAIGFVFQQKGLFSHLSARENIVLPLVAVHGWTQRDAERRADALLERFGLAEHGDKRPAELSGGQQQRAAIARAAAPRPKLLLLDEPTSALDPEYTVEVLDVVNELKDAGNDFIIVTHEMGFARHACEKTAFFANASLEEFGPSEALFTAPQTPGLKRFLGRLLEWSV